MSDLFDKVDWSKLDHAYGPADDLPALIRGLFSRDGEIQDDSLWAMYATIWHQGVIFSSTSHTIPYLISALRQPQFKLKEELLNLLAHVGTGQPYLIARKDSPLSRKEQEELTVQMSWLADIQRELVKGVDLFLETLEDDDPRIRIASAYVLACCLVEAGRITSRFRLFLNIEHEDTVRASFLLALGLMGDLVEFELATLKGALHDEDESDLVRLAGGIALAKVEGPDLRDVDFEALADLLKEQKALHALIVLHNERMEFAHGSLLSFLHNLKYGHQTRLVKTLAPLFSRLDDGYYLAETLLRFAFGHIRLQGKDRVDDITEVQKVALEAIANHDPLWEVPDDLVVQLVGIGFKGTPAREALLDFLKGERPAGG